MSNRKRYYLETNALFAISKIGQEYVTESFTSALSLLELIAGLDTKPKRFDQTKRILSTVKEKQLAIEWVLPQYFLFYMFDLAKPHTLVDKRIDTLATLMNCLIKSDSLDEFLEMDNQAFGDSGFRYLSKIENVWSGSLMEMSAPMQKFFTHSFQFKKSEYLSINGNVYETSTRKKFEDTLLTEFYHTRSVTLAAFTRDFLTGPLKSMHYTKEEVVNSYNGSADHFIDAFTCYMMRVLLGDAPNRNDIVDLNHLTYLRNFDNYYIVSDDKIFGRFCQHKRILVSELCQ